MGAEYWGRQVLDCQDDPLRVMVAREVIRCAEEAAKQRHEVFLLQMMGEKDGGVDAGTG